jgi:hypothetical protein
VLDDHVDPRIARYRSCALASKAGSTSEFRVLSLNPPTKLNRWIEAKAPLSNFYYDGSS